MGDLTHAPGGTEGPDDGTHRTATEALPTSIRQYLDDGGDVAALGEPYVSWLAEFVVYDRRHYGFPALADQARGRVDEQEMITRAAIAHVRERGDEARAQELADNHEQSKHFERWLVELAADEALCVRVEEVLPDAEVVQHLENIDAEQRPYRLVVEHRDAYRCATTGQDHDGPAIVVKGRGWYGDEMQGPELVFSPAAIEAVLAEAKDVAYQLSDDEVVANRDRLVAYLREEGGEGNLDFAERLEGAGPGDVRRIAALFGKVL